MPVNNCWCAYCDAVEMGDATHKSFVTTLASLATAEMDLPLIFNHRFFNRFLLCVRRGQWDSSAAAGPLLQRVLLSRIHWFPPARLSARKKPNFVLTAPSLDSELGGDCVCRRKRAEMLLTNFYFSYLAGRMSWQGTSESNRGINLIFLA